MPWWTVPVTLGACMLPLWFLELCFPLRERTAALGRRLIGNLLLAAVAGAVAFGLVDPLARWTLGRVEARGVGLLHWLGMPSLFAYALGFLAMDLSFYVWHRINHQVPFLWRLHRLHHTDPDLDVSTAFRFHAGEIAASAAFRVIQVLVLGIGPLLYAVYEIAMIAASLFHHSNWRLWSGLERVLRHVVITPRLHAMHHSCRRAEAFSNYGVVLVWWDRLFQSRSLERPDLVLGAPLEPPRAHAQRSRASAAPHKALST